MLVSNNKELYEDDFLKEGGIYEAKSAPGYFLMYLGQRRKHWFLEYVYVFYNVRNKNIYHASPGRCSVEYYIKIV